MEENSGCRSALLVVIMMVMSGVGMGHRDPRLVQAESQMKVITVRQDGTGNFKTILDAVASIPDGNTQRTIIKIGPGDYKEKIKVDRNKPFVTFFGEDPEAKPTIVHGTTAAQMGTWDSATVAVESEFFMAVNIVFKNSAPMPAPGSEGGQAVAMRISGDKAAFYNCRFIGFQDTLLDDVGMHYFEDCFVQGMVDFVFGKGRSIYHRCELHCVTTGITAITAQGRAGTEDNGFVFIGGSVTGNGNAYLGRAWKDSSRVIFANTAMDAFINPKGWDNFGHPEYNSKLFYAEYNNRGPGAKTGQREQYTKLLTAEQVKPLLSKSWIKAETWLLPPPRI